MSLLAVYTLLVPLEVFMRTLRRTLEERGYRIEVYDPIKGRLVAVKGGKLILGGRRNRKGYVIDFNGFQGQECVPECESIEEALNKEGVRFRRIARKLKTSYCETWGSTCGNRVYLLGDLEVEIPGSKRIVSPCG